LLELKRFTAIVEVDAVARVLAPVSIHSRRLSERGGKALNLSIINPP
jgi:hypothetical protein